MLNKDENLWPNIIEYVAESKKTFHVLLYESVVKEPVKEMEKLVEFIEITLGFKTENLKQRLVCLSENFQGTEKRKSRPQQIDPYTTKLKIKLNEDIATAEKIFAEIGLSVDFSTYKRKI